jgi:hypothetical protein
MSGDPSSPIGADLLEHSPFDPHGTNTNSVTTPSYQSLNHYILDSQDLQNKNNSGSGNQLLNMDNSDCSGGDSSDSNSSLSHDPINSGLNENHHHQQATPVSISHVHPSVIVESRSSLDNHHQHHHGSHANNMHSTHLQHAYRNNILQYILSDQENHHLHGSNHHHDDDLTHGQHEFNEDQKPSMIDLADHHHHHHHNSSNNGGSLSNTNANISHNNNQHNNSSSTNGGSSGGGHSNHESNGSSNSPNGDHQHHGLVSSSSSSR